MGLGFLLSFIVLFPLLPRLSAQEYDSVSILFVLRVLNAETLVVWNSHLLTSDSLIVACAW